MADRPELTRVASRDLGSRDVNTLEGPLAQVAERLEEREQILGAVAGEWYFGTRCLVVATSRRVFVGDQNRLEVFPYNNLQLEFSESWRKAQMVLRTQGAIADVRGIHLDRARSLRTIIQTAQTTVARVG
jgi:hypothetical protein